MLIENPHRVMSNKQQATSPVAPCSRAVALRRQEPGEGENMQPVSPSPFALKKL